jgi:hypothetical protein
MGRNGGHQQGDSTAAYGELPMATVRAFVEWTDRQALRLERRGLQRSLSCAAAG